MITYMKGQSNHNLDVKSRFIIPSRLRDRLGSSFVLCRGMDKNVYMYPQDEWEKFAEKLNALPVSDASARKFKAFFQGSAQDVEMDGQFRITIPQVLREWAGIEKEIVVIGNGNIAEIWDKKKYEEYSDIANIDIDGLSSFMSEKYGF